MISVFAAPTLVILVVCDDADQILIDDHRSCIHRQEEGLKQCPYINGLTSFLYQSLHPFSIVVYYLDTKSDQNAKSLRHNVVIMRTLPR